jgi:hypothetical protein
MADPFAESSNNIGRESTDNLLALPMSPPLNRTDDSQSRQSAIVYNSEYEPSPNSSTDSIVVPPEVTNPRNSERISIGKVEMEKWQQAVQSFKSGSKRMATSAVEERRKLETLDLVTNTWTPASKRALRRTGSPLNKKSATLRETIVAKEEMTWTIQPILKDGVILCELIRALNTKLIPYIHIFSRQAFKHKENICYFLEVQLV